jgi:anti-sigma-K factor RskA
MAHSDYQELLALHAVDALAAAEAHEVSAHLESCAECRRELAELREAAALLAHAAEPAAPSDDVRRRILRSIQSTALSREANVVPLMATSSTVWPNLLRLAAAIAFVALLLGTVTLWRRDAASRRQIAELAHQLNQQSEVLALVNSPDARKFALSGTTTAQNARATFVYDEKSRRGILMIEGLPAAPADKAYEVWFIPKGRAPIPGRTFTVNVDGRALISDSLPTEAGAAAVVAITLEPKSGSASPTGPIYLASPAS